MITAISSFIPQIGFDVDDSVHHTNLAIGLILTSFILFSGIDPLMERDVMNIKETEKRPIHEAVTYLLERS